MFSRAALLLALSISVDAVPFQKRWLPRAEGWSVSAPSWLDLVKRQSPQEVRQALAEIAASPQTCNMAQAQANTPTYPDGTNTLPPVSEGLSLYHIAVGRGTQNYTCDLSNSTAVPAAVGAVATLFNVTCSMSWGTGLFAHSLPDTALNSFCPSSLDAASPMYQDMSGHHYFTDATTAYFNLDTSLQDFGQGGFGKIASVSAPSQSVKGQYGQGYGSVPWLKLKAKSPDQNSFQEIYRLNTAGGSPPPTCQGQQSAFEIQYSAEYWFYAR